MYSKYERRTDTRTYDDRKKLYEGGWEVLRMAHLDELWKEKYDEWTKRPSKKLPKWFGERPGKKAGDPESPEDGEEAEAIKDAEAAQTAIANAVSVLEEFYKSSGMVAKQPYEFLQQGGKAPVELPESPSTWESSYTGVADPTQQPGGVVTILKTISADFAKMEADTKAQEEVDQKAYAEEVKSCEIERSRRSKQAEMKGQERARVLNKVASQEKSLKHIQDELSTVEQYLKDLAPACIEGDSTYEERKAARAAELS